MADAAPTAERGVTRRVFFALWPDAATAAGLHARARALHAECGGRAMRRDTLHLTLAFVGNVPQDGIASLEHVAAEVRGAPFVLELDQLGAWHRNRILWTSASSAPQALVALADALALRLREAGFVLEDRAFAPHITLVRNARAAPMAQTCPVLRWPVASFVLVVSEPTPAGARYRVLGRWPLSCK